MGYTRVENSLLDGCEEGPKRALCLSVLTTRGHLTTLTLLWESSTLLTEQFESSATPREGNCEQAEKVILDWLSYRRCTSRETFSFAYLEIAQLYKQQGDDEKALEWAEEGAWVFPDGGHPDLRRFLADEYHERGRHEEAMDFAWKEFAEVPRLLVYQELKDHADRAGAWERWRSKALDFLREDIARK